MAEGPVDHRCEVPDLSLQEEHSSYTCPVCGRYWYVVLEWDHAYNSDGTEWTPMYRCELCGGWAEQGYLRCKSCGQLVPNPDRRGSN